MPDTEEKRVVTTMPLEIDRAVREAGHELTLPAADAEALVQSGRAAWVEGEQPSEDERVEDAAPGPDTHEETAAPAPEHEEH